MADKPKFDPSQPFQPAGSTADKPKFDPSQPFQSAGQSASPEKSFGEKVLGYGKDVASGIGDAAKKYASAVSFNPIKNAQLTLGGAANLVGSALQQPINLISPDASNPIVKFPQFESGKPVSDVVGAVTKPVNDLVQKGSEAIGNATGIDPNRVSAAINTLGAAVPMFKGGRAAAAASPESLSIAENPVAAARAFGDKVRPSDVAKTQPETSVKSTTAIEGAAGSDELRKALMEHNQKNATAKGLEDIGASKTEPRVTPRIIDAASQAPLAKYREVGRAIGKFDPTHTDFTADLDAISQKEGLHPDSRAAITKVVDEYRDRSMSGPDTIKSISVLRRESGRNLKSDDVAKQDFGFAQRQIANAIESQVGRQLTNSGQTQLAAEFPVARQQLAKVNDVDTATRAGQIDRHILKKLQDNGAPLSGNLKILADSAEMFPHITKHPQTISNVSGGGAVPGVGPIMDVLSAGIRPAVRKFLSSDLYQNQLGKPAEAVGPNSPLGGYFPKPSTPKGEPPAPAVLPEPNYGPLKGPLLSIADEPSASSGVPFEHSAINPLADKLAGNLQLHGEQPLRAPVSPEADKLASRLEIDHLHGGSAEGPFNYIGTPFRDPGAVEPVLSPQQLLEAGKQKTNDLTLADHLTGPSEFPPGQPAPPTGKSPTAPGNGDKVTTQPSTREGYYTVSVNGKPLTEVKGREAANSLASDLGLEESDVPMKSNGRFPGKTPESTFGSDGSHTVTAPAGKLQLRKSGQYLRIHDAAVEPEARGKGVGSAMYEKAVKDAESQGLTLSSDTRVSPSAARVYDSLEKKGYTVERNAYEIDPDTGDLVSTNSMRPIFVVRSAKKKAS